MGSVLQSERRQGATARIEIARMGRPLKAEEPERMKARGPLGSRSKTLKSFE